MGPDQAEAHGDEAGQPAPESKGAQTRRAILAAAIARFGRDGYRATSVADIARDAGVGGTVAYAYFENKEALFFAAVDEDAAGVIHEGLATVLDVPDVGTLARDVDLHPGGRGGAPSAGPAPPRRPRARGHDAGARDARADRAAQGVHRAAAGGAGGRHGAPDIDPAVVGPGIVALMLSILMSVTQLGSQAAVAYSHDVNAVFEAALTGSLVRTPPLT